jgi:hypothetical protein
MGLADNCREKSEKREGEQRDFNDCSVVFLEHEKPELGEFALQRTRQERVSDLILLVWSGCPVTQRGVQIVRGTCVDDIWAVAVHVELTSLATCGPVSGGGIPARSLPERAGGSPVRKIAENVAHSNYKKIGSYEGY